MQKHWVVINDTKAIEKIIHRSNRKPQIIFKHSSRCPVSIKAYSEVSDATEKIYPEIEINYIDVVANREISRQIAEYTNLPHESPQVILLWDNDVIWTASQREISSEDITREVHGVLDLVS